MENDYVIYAEDCFQKLDELAENSIDAIVTDPPYGLTNSKVSKKGFMGEIWDGTGIETNPELWAKCLRVLKPGGYLLSFGGTRTQHRIASAIEDAGFEIRDTIAWVYGCLSEDTEVLTETGFKTLEKIEENDTICVYDVEADIYKWEKPERWSVYRIEQDTCYHIKSDSTDQLVSRNHRCLVEREGKLVFCLAEELLQMERMPILPCSLFELQETRPRELRTRRTYTTTLAAITPIKYSGKIFCPTVSTGAFVARRNGQVFITGNSGFPKSSDLGLAIDKKLGNESKVVGIGRSGAADTHTRTMHSVTQGGKEVFGGEYEVKEAQNEWKGWKSALKPAFEPIIVARKPFKGTLVNNVMTWGVGGMNIDECRVPMANEKDAEIYHFNNNGNNRSTKEGGEKLGMFDGGWKVQKGERENPAGRYPANLIHDGSEEVCAGFPQSKGASSQNNYSNAHLFGGNSYSKSKTTLNGWRDWYNDDGSAARYFYCAKASARDRDEGLEEWEASRKCGYGYDRGYQNAGEGMFKDRMTMKRNAHPTVKPTALMQYLVRLVTPRGGVVLDPFMGSGSTGKAVMFENKDREANYKFIGIEQSEEYCKIAEARIKYAKEN